MQLISIISAILVLTVIDAEYLEVCPLDGHQIRCSDHEVILIQSALYGRMRSGGCLSNTGSMGCSSNVISHVDRWCSGFRDCFLDEGLTVHLPLGDCPRHIIRYLEVTYTCVAVATPQYPECRTKNYQPTTLRRRDGFISSFTTYETQCGRASSPWVIEAPDDHVIDIRMFDFTPSGENSPGSVDIYGFIVEDGRPLKEVRIASGVERNSHLYQSDGSKVLVYVDDRFDYHSHRFMLHYEIVPEGTGKDIRILALSSGTKFSRSLLQCCLVSVASVIAVFMFTG